MEGGCWCDESEARRTCARGEAVTVTAQGLSDGPDARTSRCLQDLAASNPTVVIREMSAMRWKAVVRGGEAVDGSRCVAVPGDASSKVGRLSWPNADFWPARAGAPRVSGRVAGRSGTDC